MSQRLRNLILITKLHHGHRDMLNYDYVGPSLLVSATNYRVALKVTDLPNWSHSHRDVPDVLQSFAKTFKDALLYLLEDAPEIPPGQCVPECTYTHLMQLAEFLKETN